jgi:2-polyprenyl-6-methoxyphenol hydroxylase-like FAD-dependent oxidoreductase
MLLARKGHRVLLVDRARFPSDIPHGHFIHQQGPMRLQRWGLLDAIKASNCPGTESCSFDLNDFALESAGIQLDGVAFGYGPRRKVLDQILIEAAVRAGVEFRERCPVESFLSGGTRVTGISARGRSGEVFTEHATITIGADGRNSRLARTVNAATYETAPTLMCYCFSYWSGVPERRLRVILRPDRVFFAFPTNDDLYAVFVGATIAELPRMSDNPERHFNESLARAPSFAEILRNGHREERFSGAADLPNFYRKPFGPGWALVGDAGHHKDPYLALGLNDAFRDAEFLSDALDDAFAGRMKFEHALAQYERRRNEASASAYRETLSLARFTPMPAEMLELRAALRGNPEATRHFYMARQGLVPRESFFNPENLPRVLQAGRGA